MLLIKYVKGFTNNVGKESRGQLDFKITKRIWIKAKLGYNELYRPSLSICYEHVIVLTMKEDGVKQLIGTK